MGAREFMMNTQASSLVLHTYFFCLNNNYENRCLPLLLLFLLCTVHRSNCRLLLPYSCNLLFCFIIIIVLGTRWNSLLASKLFLLFIESRNGLHGILMTDGVSSEIHRASPDDLDVWVEGSGGSGSPHSTRQVQSPENELTAAGRDSLIAALKQIRDDETLLTEKDRYINQLQKSIKELAKQLKGVAQFIDMREDIEERLEAMEKFHKEEIAKFKSQAQVARLDMLENKVKLRLEEEILKRNHDRDVTLKATKLLDKRTREVNDQNFELVKDKLLMARDMETARAQSAKLQEENASLRRKAEIASGAEAELLLRSVAQKKQIGMLKKQVKTTEDNIEKMIKEYDERLAKQEKAFQKQLRVVTEERDAARHDAHVLRTDLKQLREVSSKVSTLHTDLQLFFHEALREVRTEVLEERRRAITGAPCGTAYKANHTASSAFRLETQPRLLITDVYGTSSRSRGEWTTDKRGFPVLVSKGGPPSLLPPIPSSTDGGTVGSGAELEGSGTVATQEDPKGFMRCVRDLKAPAVSSSQGSQTQLWRTGGSTDAEDVELEELDPNTAINPHAVPSAPSMKTLQQIDIRQLTWSEKERVLYYLFKRLQQTNGGKKHAAQHTGSSTARDAAEMGPSETFLTQQ
eukprot:gene6711-4808_t